MANLRLPSSPTVFEDCYNPPIFPSTIIPSVLLGLFDPRPPWFWLRIICIFTHSSYLHPPFWGCLSTLLRLSTLPRSGGDRISSPHYAHLHVVSVFSIHWSWGCVGRNVLSDLLRHLRPLSHASPLASYIPFLSCTITTFIFIHFISPRLVYCALADNN